MNTKQTIIILLVNLLLRCLLHWLITCGIIKLITLCFGGIFNWYTATGIWLIVILLKSYSLFNSSKN